MNLRQLRYICGIAEAGFNISRAADLLHTSQPGISKQIRLLEEELGVVLLRRHGNRIEGFTEPGLEIFATARRMVDEAQNVRRIADEFQKSRKRLVLATTHIHARYVLRPTIGEFIRRHPDVQLVLRQASPAQIAQWVVDGEVDLGITSEPPIPLPALSLLPCTRLERSIIVPTGHPLAGAKRPTLKRVSEFPILTLDQSYVGGSAVLKAFAAAGIVPDVALSAIDADVIKSYVELGLGIAILPSIAFEPGRDLGLRAIDARHLFAPAITQIELRHGRYLRSHLYEFVAMLAPQWDRGAIEQKMREDLAKPT
jgi:LysR family cys regulon transcriptional activator